MARWQLPIWRDGSFKYGGMVVISMERWQLAIWRDGSCQYGGMVVTNIERWQLPVWNDGCWQYSWISISNMEGYRNCFTYCQLLLHSCIHDNIDNFFFSKPLFS